MAEVNLKSQSLTTTTKTNFSDNSSKHQSLADQYESKVYNSLLVGTGAGFVFTLKLFSSGGSDHLPIEVLLISCWAFFFGLVSTVAAGAAYSVHSSEKSDELTQRSNQQNLENAVNDSRKQIRDNLKNSGDYKKIPKEKRISALYSDDFLFENLDGPSRKIIEVQMGKIEEIKLNIPMMEGQSKKLLKVCNWFFGFSILLFIIGVTIPLLIVTLRIL